MRGAAPPASNLTHRQVAEIKDRLAQAGVADEPVGADFAEVPTFVELHKQKIDVKDGQQVMLDAREIKSGEEIALLATAAAMVDGTYQDIAAALKPGVRENEIVALANKRRRRGGPGYRRGQGRPRAAPGAGRHQRVGRRRLRLEELMDVIVRRMGETVDKGTVNEWYKQVGDAVAEGEPLLEIGTDKVDTEIPAPAAGTLAEIRVQQGQTVPVATVLGVIT